MPAPELNTSSQPVRQPSRWRPLIILGCWVVGFVAFRFIIIEGTIFDQNFKPAWMQPSDDLFDVRKALDKADFNEAERILGKLLERQPRYGAAHERLGYVLLQKDQLEEALQHYRLAADYQPDKGEIASAIAIIKRRLSGGSAGGE